MTLLFCRDLTAADWIAHSDVSWVQLVCFGPAGFEAYARLRILPDPAHPGQSESDVEVEDWRRGQRTRLFGVLAGHTATPDDCYFCVWEGFGGTDIAWDDDAVYVNDEESVAQVGRAGAQPGVAPRSAATARSSLPKVVVPNRAFWLFRGPLTEVGNWGTAQGWPHEVRLDTSDPAFVWPGDHAWCVAHDVDPHWAGIGGDLALITELSAHPHLDVVPADPTERQPSYR